MIGNNKMFDPKLLVYFAKIGQEGTITGAARALNVAQPWLSTQMRKLEGQVGFKMFDRNSKGVVLTSKGAEFLTVALAVAASIDLAKRTAHDLQRSDRFGLRVGVPPYSSQFTSRTRLVDSFSVAHQKVGLELHVGWTPTLLDRLRHASDLDMTFALLPQDPHGELEIMSLEQSHVDLFVRTDDDLAAYQRVSPDMLKGRTLLTFTRNLNPVLFDYVYGPSRSAGAIIIEKAEIGDAAWSAAKDERRHVVTQVHGKASEASNRGMTCLMLEGSSVPFCLVRPKAQMSPYGEAFWQMAKAGMRRETTM